VRLDRRDWPVPGSAATLRSRPAFVRRAY
jgi:hypothetical protein